MVTNKFKKIDFMTIFLSVFILSVFPGCLHKNEEIKNTTSSDKKKNGKIETEIKNKKSDRKKNKEINKNNKSEKSEKVKKSSHKAFRDLDYDELMDGKKKMLSEKRPDAAIKHIEKMIPLCNNIEELRDLKLEISDLEFDLGNLKTAEKLYSDFCESYPGDRNIEYASYRAILCNYWLTLDKERDQSHTKNTISLAKSFLEREEVFREYSQDVRKILVDCKDRLLESDINIFKEYLNLGDQLSAKTRLASLEKDYKEHFLQVEPMLLTLSCDYATRFNDEKLLLAKQKELKDKYPEFVPAEGILMAGINFDKEFNKNSNKDIDLDNDKNNNENLLAKNMMGKNSVNGKLDVQKGKRLA